MCRIDKFKQIENYCHLSFTLTINLFPSIQTVQLALPFYHGFAYFFIFCWTSIDFIWVCLNVNMFLLTTPWATLGWSLCLARYLCSQSMRENAEHLGNQVHTRHAQNIFLYKFQITYSKMFFTVFDILINF